VTRNYALAAAARRVRALAERLPQNFRPDLACEWQRLTDAIEDRPDREALPAIDAWADELELRLSRALPLRRSSSSGYQVNSNASLGVEPTTMGSRLDPTACT
jgi:hypothetical protein